MNVSSTALPVAAKSRRRIFDFTTQFAQSFFTSAGSEQFYNRDCVVFPRLQFVGRGPRDSLSEAQPSEPDRNTREFVGEGYQSVPVNWGISSQRKRGFFSLCAR